MLVSKKKDSKAHNLIRMINKFVDFFLWENSMIPTQINFITFAMHM